MSGARSPRHSLDLQALLRAVDTRDLGWLDRQPEEARKTFSGWTVQRHLSAIPDGPWTGQWLGMVNERLNIRLGSAEKLDRGFAFQLAASCGLGEAQRHVWIAPPKRGDTGSDAARRLLAHFNPLANAEEIDILLFGHDGESFGEFARSCGFPPEEAQEAIDAYARITGNAVPQDESDPPRRRGKRRA